jgi:hypothetical protein
VFGVDHVLNLAHVVPPRTGLICLFFGISWFIIEGTCHAQNTISHLLEQVLNFDYAFFVVVM